MTTRTRRVRKLGAAVAGLAAACALALPAAAANAASGSYTPNPHQWYFGKWDIQQKVWPQTEGAGVTVAVVDGGVQASVPDLQGAVKPGGDMLGSGNGEVDHSSDGGHGTEVAELIAGQGVGSGQYGTAPVGIAPQAKILPVRATDPNTAPGPIASAIKYAVNHGAGVINLSIGGTAPTADSCNPQLQAAVSYALARNVVVVAAAGDTNLGGSAPEEPATCAGVLAVGGVEQTGSPWQYSTQGPDVEVAAPGDQVYVESDTGQQFSLGANGTSFSAPLVSAAAALIRSAYPSMPWYTLDQRLINTAIPGNTRNNQVGYGIIDIPKALAVTKDPVPASAPNPPYQRYKAWLQSTGQAASGSSPSGQSGSGKSSGGSSLALILGVVFAVLLIVGVVLIVAITRGRSRRGPGPGGPHGPSGGYVSPGNYSPAPGQYQQPGQPGPYASPSPQYPQPGQYQPPPGGQYPAPGQYPPRQ